MVVVYVDVVVFFFIVVVVVFVRETVASVATM